MSRVRETYDTVAETYQEHLADELAHKPLTRAVLNAFLEMAPPGPIADIGCGPGHITAFLASQGRALVGIDLSPQMVRIAREAHPDLTFEVGSMTGLEAPDDSWSGIVAMYSVIHLEPFERTRAYNEFARTLRPGGLLFLTFHVEAEGHPAGSGLHLDDWWDHAVDIDAYFLEPDAEIARLEAAGLTLVARTDRAPGTQEYPSRRTLLLLRKPTDRT